jgi:hypothetical protein
MGCRAACVLKTPMGTGPRWKSTATIARVETADLSDVPKLCEVRLFVEACYYRVTLF